MGPKNLVLVRHGESEGNVAFAASAAGDHSYFTPEFLERHSSSFRLTSAGIEQSRRAGSWIREHIGDDEFHEYMVADYARAVETAAHLGLPNARWRRMFQLRERDMALMDNIPLDVRKQRYVHEVAEWKKHPFYSYPAGSGESVAQLCHRLSGTLMPELEQRWNDANVLIVTLQ